MDEMPITITPKGLDAKRQWYLYDEIRQFVEPSSQDLVTPLSLVPKTWENGCWQLRHWGSGCDSPTTCAAKEIKAWRPRQMTDMISFTHRLRFIESRPERDAENQKGIKG